VARGRYEIIAGERRFRAAKMADLKTVPVIVRKIGDSQALVMGLIENIQREDLNALEEAAGIERLVTEFGMTHETASKAVGKSRSQVTNLLRLLKLTEAVQELLMKDAITMGHARALLALDGAKQVQAAGEVVAKGLSVHETEKLVQAIQRGKTTSSRTKAVKTADTVKAENALADALGAPVEIRADKKGRGRLIIGFADFDALDGIMQRIVGP